MAQQDPLDNPRPLIERVYAYVAYRIGDGPDAEDVTSQVFERALRYRASYDQARGEPVTWLLGIARRCVDDALAHRSVPASTFEHDEPPAPGEVEGDVIRRVELARGLGRLNGRDRDLIALRFGADLTARRIGEVLGLKSNAVEVSLHRALARLRSELADEEARAVADPSGTAPRTPTPPPTGTGSSHPTSDPVRRFTRP